MQSDCEFGYVFVLLGDLTKINCDYWIGPSGGVLDPRRQKGFPLFVQMVDVPCPDSRSWQMNGYMGKLHTFEPWPTHIPKPYNVSLNVGRGENEKYINELERFIRAAASDCAAKNPNGLTNKVRKHVCPLIAVPLLGTGCGGNYRNTGKMVKALLPRLYSLANELKVDIAIITIEEDVYKLIQCCRAYYLEKKFKTLAQIEKSKSNSPLAKSSDILGGNSYLSNVLKFFQQVSQSSDTSSPSTSSADDTSVSSAESPVSSVEHALPLPPPVGVALSSANLPAPPSSSDNFAISESEIQQCIQTMVGTRYLSRTLLERIPELVGKALEGNLSLFVGAGASMGAGLPSWGELLSKIADKVGLEQELMDEFKTLDYYTKAAILDNRITQANKANGSTKTLGHYVKELITASRYSVIHSLLASLPVHEIITTNYDNLLEKSWVLSGPFSVLPNKTIAGCKKWLLKMHGSTDNPEDIVFTKQDYVRYADKYAALAGILQSMLLTKHLLFVGFSLDDDNFYRIFDSVQKARGTPEESDMRVISRGVSGNDEDDAFSSIDNWEIKNQLIQKYQDFNNFLNVGVEKSKMKMSSPVRNKSVCGTALLLEHAKWKEELWRGLIDMAFLQGSSKSTLPKDVELAQLARKQEIFLDILSFECSRHINSKFLMVERYRDALSPGELEMKEFLNGIISSMKDLSDEAKASGPYLQMMRNLHEFGAF